MLGGFLNFDRFGAGAKLVAALRTEMFKNASLMTSWTKMNMTNVKSSIKILKYNSLS